MTRRPTSILATTVVITVAVALTFQGALLFQSRERALQLMTTRAANRAQSTADGVEALFGELDLALLAIRDAVVPEQVIAGPTDVTRAEEERMRRLLLLWQGRTPSAIRFHVVSANGRFVYSTLTPLPVPTVDDRPYFQAQKAATSDAFRPTECYFSRVSQDWSLYATRRLQTTDGRFAGVVMTVVGAESLSRELTAVDQSQWFLGAFDSNRLLVASNPMRKDWFGRPFADAFLTSGLQTGRSEYRGPALGLGVSHLWATRRVGTYPLVTVAGFSESLALAQWRRDLQVNLLVAGLLVAGCLGILLALRRNERAAHQLQASEAYFRTLFDAVPHAVAVIEAGRVVDCNLPYRQMFEVEVTETRPPWLLASELQSNGLTAVAAGDRLYEGALSGTLKEANWRCRRSRGEVFEAEIRATFFPHEGRQLVVATVRDLTEQRSMEEKLHQAQKLDALGQLAGGVAHDFNNMLAAILASAELMSPDEPLDVQQELRDTIVVAAGRAAKLTSKLLAFARKGKILSTPLDAHGVVRETVALLERTIDPRIAIGLELDATSSTVIGDASQLQSALLNLGVNARDAMPSGGSLIIATQNRTLSDSDCTLGASRLVPGDYLCITVADTGEGMTAEVMKHVFDPFFTTKETGKGTGLGLAAVFGTMASHHGAVTVESVLGQGSRFTLYLPVAPFSSVGKSVLPEHLDRGSGVVLVVDDEELVRTSTAMQLKSLGYSSVAIGDPEQAVDAYLAHQGQIVAVLLDMVMPKIMGLDVAAKIRQVAPTVPIVLVSGFPRTSQLEQWLGKTIDAFLQKPYSQAELGRTLATVCSARGNPR